MWVFLPTHTSPLTPELSIFFFSAPFLKGEQPLYRSPASILPPKGLAEFLQSRGKDPRGPEKPLTGVCLCLRPKWFFLT